MLRQLRFPPELRLAMLPPDAADEPAAADTVETLARLHERADALERELHALQSQRVAAADRESARTNAERDQAGFMCRLASAVWSLGNAAARLEPAGSGRAVHNRVQALNRLLQAQQLEIEDLSGTLFDPGELWDQVIGDQSVKRRPVISSMQAPRVRWQGRTIQRGTPIVEDSADEPSAGA